MTMTGMVTHEDSLKFKKTSVFRADIEEHRITDDVSRIPCEYPCVSMIPHDAFGFHRIPPYSLGFAGNPVIPRDWFVKKTFVQ